MRKKYFSIDQLLDHFNLLKKESCDVLDKWMEATHELSPMHRTILQEKHILVKREGPYWNEEELKIQFISFVLDIAQINEPGKIKLFFERSLKAQWEDFSLSVKCDCLLASPLGINTPKKPYFFLQEFKKGKGDKYDPEAQMLAAMLIAQQLNSDEKPVYGGFVVGQFWNFSTLIKQEYCVSITLDATQWEELQQIVFVLHQLKTLILND